MIRQEFWATNISNMNVSLSDLNLTIKAFSSVNLLDTRHYSYTIEQLEKSRNSGSLSRKRNKIVIRDVAPKTAQMHKSVLKEACVPNRARSVYEIKNEKYEELAISDEKFAEENAEIADLDSKPLVIKEKT
jgi:hypothetical protein